MLFFWWCSLPARMLEESCSLQWSWCFRSTSVKYPVWWRSSLALVSWECSSHRRVLHSKQGKRKIKKNFARTSIIILTGRVLVWDVLESWRDWKYPSPPGQCTSLSYWSSCSHSFSCAHAPNSLRDSSSKFLAPTQRKLNVGILRGTWQSRSCLMLTMISQATLILW